MLDIFFKNKNKSKNIAKDRLKLVLVHDRTDISPKLMEDMKSGIIGVISRYLEIDINEIEFKVTRTVKERNGSSSELVANIPILRVRND